MRRQRRHLGQIAHRGFWRVELPVGVGGKAGGGVPRQIGQHRGQRGRVPRQHGLQALDGVCHKHGGGREAEHGKGVLPPVHLGLGIHRAQLVDKPLDGAEYGIEPGALALQHALQIQADRAHGQQQNNAKHKELQPAIGGHC